jgi:hypothetical protein
MILAVNWDNWVVFGYLLGNMSGWMLGHCLAFPRDHPGHYKAMLIHANFEVSKTTYCLC